MPMALTPYGGWHQEDKDLAESWTRKTTHTGDGVGYYEFDQRFEHPGRTSGVGGVEPGFLLLLMVNLSATPPLPSLLELLQHQLLITCAS